MKRFIEGDIVSLKEEKVEELKQKLLSKNMELIESTGSVVGIDKENKKIKVLMRIKKNNENTCIRLSTDESNLIIKEEVFIPIRMEDKLAEILLSLGTEIKALGNIGECSARKGYGYLSIDTIDNEPFIRAIAFDKIPEEYISGVGRENVNRFMRSDYYKKRSVAFKPIKLLNKILDTKITDMDEINKIIYMLSEKEIYEFEIVEGEYITKYYNEAHYMNGESSLNHSCMRYDECGGYFNVYEDNCQMVILKDKILDKIYGRAILWPNTEVHIDGKPAFRADVMDRIYVSKDYLYNKFHEFAEENGFIYTTSTCPYPEDWIYNGDNYTLQRDIWFKFYLCDPLDKYYSYPYIDTMACCNDIEESVLYSGGDNTEFDIEFHSTDGEYYDNRDSYDDDDCDGYDADDWED